ncbi:hypothetical protein AOLI_G00092350 [Acnodon oligacanthus]
MMELMLLSHLRSLVIVVPRNLQDSTATTDLSRMHQVFVAAPKDHLINHPSVSRFVTVSNETNDCSVICILQDFD